VRRAVEQPDADRIGPLDDVEISQNMAQFVNDEARTGARRGLVAEEAGGLGFGGDVDDPFVGRGVDQHVGPLFRVEVLQNIGRRSWSLVRSVLPLGRDGTR